MTPKEFKERAYDFWITLIESKRPDREVYHSNTDSLMEQALTELGYSEGVEIIQRGERWYA